MNSKFPIHLFASRTLCSLALVLSLIGITCPSMGHEHEKKTSDRGAKNTGSVLVFAGTGWYRHPETAAVSGWLARLSDELEMQVDVTETPKDILALLDRYDVLVLNNSNKLVDLLDEKQRKKIEDWYNAGGGIVAIHAALVKQTDWEWFSKLGGCDFDSDSEFLEARVLVDPAAKDHPTVKGFGEEFLYSADWTNHTESVTGKPGFQVLLRVDESTFEPVREYFQTRGGKPMGEDHPVAWTNTLNGGRFFYTELGHDVRSLETPFGRQHIIEAIKWAAEDGGE
ncbi:MAG: ThuA domain-containing protein [Verrucomicrobiales bacterium]|nr:ThuA domain-containing protein [Verrucomicrobiales bacterium]